MVRKVLQEQTKIWRRKKKHVSLVKRIAFACWRILCDGYIGVCKILISIHCAKCAQCILLALSTPAEMQSKRLPPLLLHPTHGNQFQAPKATASERKRVRCDEEAEERQTRNFFFFFFRNKNKMANDRIIIILWHLSKLKLYTDILMFSSANKYAPYK